MNIHLANAASCGTNLISIGKGPDSVPALVGDCPEPVAAATPVSTVGTKKPTSTPIITTPKLSKTTSTRRTRTSTSKSTTTPGSIGDGDIV